MDPVKAKQCLEKLMPLLSENLDFDNIKTRLFSKELLTMKQMNEIEDIGGQEGKMEQVIKILIRSGPKLGNDFETFLNILKETNNEPIRTRLLKAYKGYRMKGIIIMNI